MMTVEFKEIKDGHEINWALFSSESSNQNLIIARNIDGGNNNFKVFNVEDSEHIEICENKIKSVDGVKGLLNYLDWCLNKDYLITLFSIVHYAWDEMKFKYL